MHMNHIAAYGDEKTEEAMNLGFSFQLGHDLGLFVDCVKCLYVYLEAHK